MPFFNKDSLIHIDTRISVPEDIPPRTVSSLPTVTATAWGKRSLYSDTNLDRDMDSEMGPWLMMVLSPKSKSAMAINIETGWNAYTI